MRMVRRREKNLKKKQVERKTLHTKIQQSKKKMMYEFGTKIIIETDAKDTNRAGIKGDKNDRCWQFHVPVINTSTRPTACSLASVCCGNSSNCCLLQSICINSLNLALIGRAWIYACFLFAYSLFNPVAYCVFVCGQC